MAPAHFSAFFELMASSTTSIKRNEMTPSATNALRDPLGPGTVAT